MAAALSFPFHHKGVDQQFVVACQAVLDHDTDFVVDYAKNPPALTTGDDDTAYLRRAADDINAAISVLDQYKHHKATKEDVSTALTQAATDLADIPPAHWLDQPEDQI
jgi:hypothetical protein